MIYKRDFKQIFNFRENEKTKKELKKEFKTILEQARQRASEANEEPEFTEAIKFKDVIDYYLTCSQSFYDLLREFDAQSVICTIQSGHTSSQD